MPQVIVLSSIYFLSLIAKPGFNPFDLMDFILLLLSFTVGIVFLALYVPKISNSSVVFYFFLCVCVFSLITFFTILTSSNLSGLATLIQHFIFLPLIAFFIVPVETPELKNDPTLMFLSIVGILIILLGFVHQNTNILHYNGLLKDNRFSGLLGNPNVNATFIYFTWIFTLVLLNDTGKRNSILHTSIASFPFLFFIILTWSRRVFIVFSITYLILLFSRMKLFGKLSLIILFVLLGVTTFLSLSYSEVDFRSESTASRLRELFDLTHGISFFVGGGPGNFGVASQFTSDSSHFRVHNYYLQLILDYGLVLGVMVVLMLFSPIFFLSNKFDSLELRSFTMLRLALFGSFLLGFFGLTTVTFPMNLFQVVISALLIKRFIMVEKRAQSRPVV